MKQNVPLLGFTRESPGELDDGSGTALGVVVHGAGQVALDLVAGPERCLVGGLLGLNRVGQIGRQGK